MIESVYELVDVSDDEAYYSQGLFLSVQDAIDAVDQHFADRGEPPHEYHYETGDVISLEIRKRGFGLAEMNVKPEWSRKWRRIWDDESYADDGRWVEMTPDVATGQ